jgi:hypothetical protein
MLYPDRLTARVGAEGRGYVSTTSWYLPTRDAERARAALRRGANDSLMGAKVGDRATTDCHRRSVTATSAHAPLQIVEGYVV